MDEVCVGFERGRVRDSGAAAVDKEVGISVRIERPDCLISGRRIVISNLLRNRF